MNAGVHDPNRGATIPCQRANGRIRPRKRLWLRLGLVKPHNVNFTLNIGRDIMEQLG